MIIYILKKLEIDIVFLYLYLNYKTKLLKYNYFIKFKKIFLIKRFYQK